MGRPKKVVEEVKPLTQKAMKDTLREAMIELATEDVAPDTFKAEFMGFNYNDKGKFVSVVFSIEAKVTTKTHGTFVLSKDVTLPVGFSDLSR